MPILLHAKGLLAVIFLCLASSAQAFDTSAKAAFVLDYDTGTVLLSKRSDEPLPPASMSKLMTLNMVFEALNEGRLSLDDTFRVSEKASKMGGSKMFVREGASVSIDDLIRGVIVQSGNDACVVLAEGLAGSEAAFAERMTRRAKSLGMSQSTFANSTGWPHPAQRMSARDLVFLAERLIREFPQYYGYFKEETFTWEDIKQANRNPLLKLGIGADGLKTGHTEEAGYGLVGSAKQDGRRIVFMITGMTSSKERSVEAERMTSWAFREFTRKVLFEKGAAVSVADIWLGEKVTVDLVAGEDLAILVPFGVKDEITASVAYRGPIEAPIDAGQKLAELIVNIPGLDPVRHPLVAAEAINRGGFLRRVQASAQILLGQAMEAVAGGTE